jgi:hypothetical protein
MLFPYDPLFRRSVCAAGQPALSLVRRCIGLSTSDREFPLWPGSGTQRARRLRGRGLAAVAAISVRAVCGARRVCPLPWPAGRYGCCQGWRPG